MAAWRIAPSVAKARAEFAGHVRDLFCAEIEVPQWLTVRRCPSLQQYFETKAFSLGNRFADRSQSAIHSCHPLPAAQASTEARALEQTVFQTHVRRTWLPRYDTRRFQLASRHLTCWRLTAHSAFCTLQSAILKLFGNSILQCTPHPLSTSRRRRRKGICRLAGFQGRRRHCRACRRRQAHRNQHSASTESTARAVGSTASTIVSTASAKR